MRQAGPPVVDADHRELLDKLHDLTRPRGEGACRDVDARIGGDAAARAYLDHFWKLDAWLQALRRSPGSAAAPMPE